MTCDSCSFAFKFGLHGLRTIFAASLLLLANCLRAEMQVIYKQDGGMQVRFVPYNEDLSETFRTFAKNVRMARNEAEREECLRDAAFKYYGLRSDPAAVHDYALFLYETTRNMANIVNVIMPWQLGKRPEKNTSMALATIFSQEYARSQKEKDVPNWNGNWDNVLPKGEATSENIGALAAMLTDMAAIDDFDGESDKVQELLKRHSDAMARWRVMVRMAQERASRAWDERIARQNELVKKQEEENKRIDKEKEQQRLSRKKELLAGFKELETQEDKLGVMFLLEFFDKFHSERRIIDDANLPNLDTLRKAYRNPKNADIVNLYYKLVVKNDYKGVLEGLESMSGVEDDDKLLYLWVKSARKTGKPKDIILRKIDKLIKLAPESRPEDAKFYKYLKQFIERDEDI